MQAALSYGTEQAATPDPEFAVPAAPCHRLPAALTAAVLAGCAALAQPDPVTMAAVRPPGVVRAVTAPAVPSEPSSEDAAARDGRRWVKGEIAIAYNPAGEPQQVAGRMAEMIASAVAQWNTRCGLRLAYRGTSTAPGTVAADPVVIGWSALGREVGGEALLNYGIERRTVRIAGAAITLNSAVAVNAGHLRYVILHELGHVLGLDHSGIAGTVMSGPPWTSYSVRSMLTAADVTSCSALYGAPATVARRPGVTYRTTGGPPPTTTSSDE